MQSDYLSLLEELGNDRSLAPMPSDSAGVDAEIKAMNKMMADRSSAYWKGPNAERNQERYRSLLRGRE